MIYLDHFFFGFTDQACYFDHYEQIPDNCDIVGLVFYSFDRETIINTVKQIKHRTRKLLVVIAEPVGNLVEILEIFQHDPDIIFFGDAVLDQPHTNFYPAISWFLTTNNYYANETWAQNLLSSLNHDHDKPFKFDCLLGQQRRHRNMVDLLYQQSKVQDCILFNYFKTDINLGAWNRDCTQYKLTSNAVLVDSTADNINYHAPLSAILPDYIYNQSLHSIVCETTCSNMFSQFTEKVAKPMLAQRIFVAFCGQWYLRNLRSLGFQTFDSIIDESYDSEPDITIRYQKAWAQVEYLCRIDSAQARTQVQHILDHNQQHFLKTDWHHNIKQFLN